MGSFIQNGKESSYTGPGMRNKIGNMKRGRKGERHLILIVEKINVSDFFLVPSVDLLNGLKGSLTAEKAGSQIGGPQRDGTHTHVCRGRQLGGLRAHPAPLLWFSISSLLVTSNEAPTSSPTPAALPPDA